MKKIFKKNICCIGAGYVGGPTMSVIALHCPEFKIKSCIFFKILRLNLTLFLRLENGLNYFETLTISHKASFR